MLGLLQHKLYRAKQHHILQLLSVCVQTRSSHRVCSWYSNNHCFHHKVHGSIDSPQEFQRKKWFKVSKMLNYSYASLLSPILAALSTGVMGYLRYAISYSLFELLNAVRYLSIGYIIVSNIIFFPWYKFERDEREQYKDIPSSVKINEYKQLPQDDKY